MDTGTRVGPGYVVLYYAAGHGYGAHGAANPHTAAGMGLVALRVVGGMANPAAVHTEGGVVHMHTAAELEHTACGCLAVIVDGTAVHIKCSGMIQRHSTTVVGGHIIANRASGHGEGGV